MKIRILIINEHQFYNADEFICQKIKKSSMSTELKYVVTIISYSTAIWTIRQELPHMKHLACNAEISATKAQSLWIKMNQCYSDSESIDNFKIIG